MEIKGEIKERLDKLSEAIERNRQDPALYMERGKLYNSCGVRDKALNDFLMVTRLNPSDTEAREYIKMINEIFDFRYLDYYNP